MRLRDRTSPLARRLLLYVVLFSSAVTLLLTAYQLYRDYRLDLAQIDNEFTEIERVHLRTLASALWATDKAELEVHLDGMRGIRDIEYLAVVEPGRVWAQTGAPRTENAIERRYVLRHPHRGQERQIGELVVIASLDGVYARLLDKVVVILVSNGVKTFLVATFILFLFHWLVTRHVHAVVEQTQREHMGDIALERTPHGGRRDELDDLVTALNAMRAKLTTSLTHLRDREGQLSLITDNLPGLVARVDRDLRYLFVNAQYERWFGLPPAAIIGRRVPEVIGAEAFARFEPYARRALAGERVSFESWIKVASGQVVYGQATYVPDVGPDGEVRGHFTLVTDITERVQAAQQAHKLSSAIEQTADSVVITDREGVIEYVNPAFEAITGFASAEALGHKPSLVKSGKQDEAFYRNLWNTILHGEVFRAVFINRRKNGTLYHEEKTITPVRDATGTITHFVSTGKDITERVRAEERLSFLAHHDELTGLPNRVLFGDRLRQAMIDAERHDRLVAVVFVDLDRFKNVNDTLGHEAGDQMLKDVTERLLGAVRRGDTVARLSGDEFTVVLADMAHVDDAARVAQKILDVFTQPFHVVGRDLFMGASLGITVFPFDTRDAGELLRNADIAMYRAKEAGRNVYQFYAAEMTTKATEAMALENELRHGLERGEFLLHYQPIVDSGGNILGAEALLRWQHSQRGLVPPAQFIPLAEETGLILPIGDWVLRQACAQARAWRGPNGALFHMSVNVSPRQFRHSGLAQTVETILQETGLDPHALNIEITESVLMQKETLTQELFNQLSGHGVSFSIDDFGTGYSSLSYLKRFAINHLKIDQSFIRDVTTDPDDAALVQAIISMAHSLGIQTVAEGVETWEQRAFLLEHGCDAMQGYYFSRPVPPEAFAALLATGKPLLGNGSNGS